MKPPLGSFLLVWSIAICIGVLLSFCTAQWQVVRYGHPDVDDYKVFVNDTIEKGPVVYHLPKAQAAIRRLDTLRLRHPQSKQSLLLADYLNQTQTKAFLVIQDDSLVYEKYFDGYTKSTIHCTFSVSKSLISVLTGAAVGQFPELSLQKPITTYLPELTDQHPHFQKLTLEDLLAMKSGLSYSTFQRWTDVFCDNNLIYYTKNQKKYISKANFSTFPGTHRQYKSFDPILVAWAIENVTHQRTADFFTQAIWQTIGAEYDAYWSLDRKNGLIKASSSFHCTAIDLAKIGLLYLHQGRQHQGRQIIPAAWIQQTVGPAHLSLHQPVINKWWQPAQTYFWWFSTLEPRGDYYADGYKGQFLYINPSTKTVIVKFSEVEDALHDVPFRKIADCLHREN